MNPLGFLRPARQWGMNSSGGKGDTQQFAVCCRTESELESDSDSDSAVSLYPLPVIRRNSPRRPSPFVTIKASDVVT
jgi:hypothetical protein